MRNYHYDHVHLRSPDPDATARFFETMFGAEVTRSVYPPGTLYPGQQRITMRLGGQKVLRVCACRYSVFSIYVW
jgi:lactoylglutathione lyase